MKIVFVVGTTASGKSDYAIKRAQRNSISKKTAIVNCDSVQVYQGLVIGSALPSREEMSLVPHYLYSYVSKGERITAGQYCRAFYALMEKMKDEFAEILVVGGTGFYFQAIEKGMFDVGGENPYLREQLQKRLQSAEEAKILYEEFADLDPIAAKRIFPNDHFRLVRAMELMLTHKKSLTEIQSEFEKSPKKFPWSLEKVGIRVAKEDLRSRIELRTQKMLRQGLVDEVKKLRNQGLRQWAPMESVGYKEVNLYLDQAGEIPDQAALHQRIVMNTMKLAKKQRTWFQRDQEINWQDCQ